MSRRATAPRAPAALHHDPLGEEQILERFYRPAREPAAIPPTSEELQAVGTAAAVARKPKPAHYKIVCISLYNEDIERLAELVRELKRRGHTKANKSQIIRAALDQIDLGKIPKGY